MAEREFETDAQVYGMPEAPADPMGGADAAHDDFDKAIAEYGEAIPKVEPQPQQAQQVDADEVMKNLPAELKADLERGYNSGLYHLQELAQKVSAERDRQDGQRLFDEMRRSFPDLSERVVKAMLVSRYHGDPRTSSAWDNRYGNKAGWSREVERIRSEFAAETARPIDHEQTAVRAAIDAAMLRGTNGPPREAVQPNLNSLSDADYQRHVKEEHGYTPKIR